ncbi:2-amino-4-hydroxy-6-hydroxymethyldihydropteridine diphosphokinase [Natronoglycomyces albus]|uniref:2-amino-4-hydroxy-6-hydroxymethyldihydropteridine diphosphokinase n=1 Tax=Natronoglycomyces albus TaxID=2811108 RepID=A0A895XTS3_9ACTN|nr:2-amino-4-hydroxy-6-hydroxymethyldihydropteridine diphosphokinase [Natronoglycomyces albus]QSB05650.1 2-amino-4-hydroxy-6-hydroxymethyldihydropteridine diphosphokinase [Natronoglycomyces albus]
MSTVVLSLGANLGDREENLTEALDHLRPDLASDLYETPPWGEEDQPAYFNLTVICTRAGHTAHDWLSQAAKAEMRAGRLRDPQRPYGPRTLDVDIIAAWDDHGDPVLSNDPQLTLPHPRAHLRAFVLVPWLAIDPAAELPGVAKVRTLLRKPNLAADARSLRRLHPIWSNDHG